MPSEVKRLKQRVEENGRLRKLVADLSLDKEMLQDVIERKLVRGGARTGGAQPLTLIENVSLSTRSRAGSSWSIGAGFSGATRRRPRKTLCDRWKRCSEAAVFLRMLAGLSSGAAERCTVIIDATCPKARRASDSQAESCPFRRLIALSGLQPLSHPR